jgi:hypothetical protein
MITRYEYGHQGRLLNEKVQMDGQTEVTLAANQYNAIGEPITKYLHGSGSGSNFNQQIGYTYSTRGWLRSINQPGNLGTDFTSAGRMVTFEEGGGIVCNAIV